MIERPSYTRLLRQYRDQALIKIVTGVRRAGKSTLFQLFIRELKEQGIAEEQIQTLNLEVVDNEALLDYRRLYQHVKEHLAEGKQNYVFLDEIQNVPDFQKAVRSLADRGNVDLYLTGSNSKLQSGEWATSIAGRYVEIHVLPLSFREFVSALPEQERGRDEAFALYTRLSSFPQVMAFPSELRQEQGDRYLSDLYNSIVLKDIMDSRGIREVSRLDRLARFMSGSVGSELSIKKISDTMTSDGVKVSVPTVENYVQAFRDSYLFYKADRYDVRGKKMLRTQNKYYIVDPGLRRLLIGNASVDLGHVLENIVYLELLRRGYRVSIARVETQDKESGSRISVEVDFVAVRGQETCYFQVCETIRDAATLERELRPLRAIRDSHPKFLLTRDYDSVQFDGIRHLNVLKWLLGEE